MVRTHAKQYGQFERIEIADLPDTDLLHSGLCNLPNSRDTTNRKLHQKVLHFVGLDDEESIRLPPIGGNLCQELVRGDAGRSRQLKLLVNLPSNRLRHPSCCW